MNKMLNARGFTLIELVVVIVILGILAATAAPRFIDVSSSAKVATLDSIAGTMKSSIKLVNMKARVKDLKLLIQIRVIKRRTLLILATHQRNRLAKLMP